MQHSIVFNCSPGLESGGKMMVLLLKRIASDFSRVIFQFLSRLQSSTLLPRCLRWTSTESSGPTQAQRNFYSLDDFAFVSWYFISHLLIRFVFMFFFFFFVLSSKLFFNM